MIYFHFGKLLEKRTFQADLLKISVTMPMKSDLAGFLPQVAYLDEDLLVQRTRLGTSSVNVLVKESI